MRGVWLVLLWLVALLGSAAALPASKGQYIPPHGSDASRAAGSGVRNSKAPGRVVPSPDKGDRADTSADSYTIVLAIGCIMALIIVAVWISSRGQKQPGAAVKVDEVARRKELETLRQQDPHFDEAAMAERSKQLLLAIDAAWNAGSMAAVRRSISDGIYVRFQTQMALLRHEGLRNVVADPTVERVEISGAATDAHWETLHIRMLAVARDCDVPADTNDADAMQKAAEAAPTKYEERWRFLRRRGARSKNVAAGNCANCANALPAGETVVCANCNALTNSGEHDWVLAGITQPDEPRAEAGRDPEELNTLRGRDPGLSRQELEDRATVMFWKWLEARATGERRHLERFCLSVGLPEAPKTKLNKIAVGAADVVLIRPAEVPSGVDHVEVELRWSASLDDAEPRGMVHRVILARSAEAQSRRGLCLLNCPSCAGELADSPDVICGHCKEPLTGARHEWALASVVEVVG